MGQMQVDSMQRGDNVCIYSSSGVQRNVGQRTMDAVHWGYKEAMVEWSVSQSSVGIVL